MFVFRFRLQVRVQDETGTVSVSLFNDEVQAILNNVTAYQLVEKYGKVLIIIVVFQFHSSVSNVLCNNHLSTDT